MFENSVIEVRERKRCVHEIETLVRWQDPSHLLFPSLPLLSLSSSLVDLPRHKMAACLLHLRWHTGESCGPALPPSSRLERLRSSGGLLEPSEPCCCS